MKNGSPVLRLCILVALLGIGYSQKTFGQLDSVLTPYDLGPAFNTSSLPPGTLYRDNKGYAAVDTPVLAPSTSASRIAATYTSGGFALTYIDEAISSGSGFNDATTVTLSAGHPLGTSTTLGALRKWTAAQVFSYIGSHVTIPSGQTPKICFLKSVTTTPANTKSGSLAKYQINYPVSITGGGFDGGSLANKMLSGTSTTSPYDAYITIDFSNNAWYIFDVTTGAYVTRNINSDAYNTSIGSDIDLYSVILQQATHSLGLTSLISKFSPVGVSAVYSTYDQYLTAGPSYTIPNQPLIDPTTHSLNSNVPLTSFGVVYSNAANAKDYAIFSPDKWTNSHNMSYLSSFKDVVAYEDLEGYCGGLNRNWSYAEMQILCNLGYTVTGFSTFSCSDHLPVAMNDVTSTTANASVTMDVTLNDNDPDGQTIAVLPGSVQLLSPNGSVSLSGNNITFVPDGVHNEVAYIRYTPYTPVNGATGTDGYMIITVTNGSRAYGDPCNLIENGSFENGMSLPQFIYDINHDPIEWYPIAFDFGAAPPWQRGDNSPQVYFRGSVSSHTITNFYNIPVNVAASSLPGVETYTSGGRKYAGLGACAKGVSSNISSDGIYQQLIQPLVAGISYTLTYRARAVQWPSFSSCNDPNILVTFTTSTPGFSPSSYVTGPVSLSDPIAQYNSSSTAPVTTTWTVVTRTFTPTVSGLSYIAIEGKSIASNDDQPYIFIDDIRLTQTGATTTPTVSISPNPASLCQGAAPITLTASGTPSGGSYTWNTGATTAAINVAPSGTVPYTVTYNGTNQCSASTSVNVTVKPLPSPSISPASPSVCLGSGVTLTATGGASYVWSTGSTASTTTLTPGATGTYPVSVTATGANGCTASTSTTVTAIPAPTASISPAAATICQGSCTTLTASGGASYLWSTGATTASISVCPGTTTTYTVSVTAANGCTASKNVIVTVNPAPVVTITPASPSICAGSSSTLTASGGGTYLWSTSATTAAITVTPLSTTAYSVTVTGANGCTAANTVTVTVNPLPTASITPPSSTLCSGSSATLTAAGGGTYLWSNFVTTPANAVSPTVTTTYSVTVTSAASCTASASATVTVIPGVTANAGGPYTITSCTAGCIKLGGNQGTPASAPTAGGGTGSYTYTWSPSATGTNPCVPVAAGTYNLTVTDAGNGCSASSSATISMSATGFTQILDGLDNVDARIVADMVSDNHGDIYAAGRFYNDIFYQQSGPAIYQQSTTFGSARSGIYIAMYSPCNGNQVVSYYYRDNSNFLWPCNSSNSGSYVKYDNICVHPYSNNIALDASENLYSAASGHINADHAAGLITRLNSHYTTGSAADYASFVDWFVFTDIESDPSGNVYVAGYNANVTSMTFNGITFNSGEYFVGKIKTSSSTSLAWDWMVKPTVPGSTSTIMKYTVDGILSLGTYISGHQNYLILSAGTGMSLYYGDNASGGTKIGSGSALSVANRTSRVAVYRSTTTLALISEQRIQPYKINITAGTFTAAATATALPERVGYDVKVDAYNNIYAVTSNRILQYKDNGSSPYTLTGISSVPFKSSGTYTTYLSPDYSALDRCLTFDNNLNAPTGGNNNIYIGGIATNNLPLKINGVTITSTPPHYSTYGFITRVNSSTGAFFKTEEMEAQDAPDQASLTDAKPSVTLFPIPATTSLNFIFNVTTEKASINIYDVTGKLVLHQDVAVNGDIVSMDVSPLADAPYEVRVTAGNDVFTKKIVKAMK